MEKSKWYEDFTMQDLFPLVNHVSSGVFGVIDEVLAALHERVAAGAPHEKRPTVFLSS